MQICFYARGDIPNSRILIRAQVNDRFRWYGIYFEYLPSDNEWQRICVDMWDYLRGLVGEEGQLTFIVRRIYFDYPPEGSDFWIDEFRVTSASQPTGKNILIIIL